LVRRLRGRPARAVVLMEDETTLRLFPPLRAAWALRGQQARVRISGNNDQRTLFGAMNLQTGHRILLAGSRPNQVEFQRFLRRLRCGYPGRPLCLLLDRARNHTAPQSQDLARQLGCQLLWLPKQAAELNAMDQLWKELKKEMVSNHQFEPIERGVRYALDWIASLSNCQALTKGGVRSQNFWLKSI
jgi:hypothetical protein